MKRSDLMIGGLIVGGLGLIAGCESKPAKSTNGASSTTQNSGGATPAATPPATVSLPTDLFVEAAPPDARGVGELKADAQASGSITITGKVGGRVNPFVEGAAIFVLTDGALKSCTDLHPGACETPWDYCCEPKDSLMANTATIQVVDKDGKPLRTSLEGAHGLIGLATVTVVGTIAEKGDDLLIVNAEHIHVTPSAGG